MGWEKDATSGTMTSEDDATPWHVRAQLLLRNLRYCVFECALPLSPLNTSSTFQLHPKRLLIQPREDRCLIGLFGGCGPSCIPRAIDDVIAHIGSLHVGVLSELRVLITLRALSACIPG